MLLATILYSFLCFIKIINLIFCSEFQKLWRSVAVDGLDDDKIEEYLQKQGITSMQDTGVKKVVRVLLLLIYFLTIF